MDRREQNLSAEQLLINLSKITITGNKQVILEMMKIIHN